MTASRPGGRPIEVGRYDGRTVTGLTDDLALLIQRGGFVMIPLLALSIMSLTLIIERSCFWIRIHGAAGVDRLTRLNDALRRGDRQSALSMVAQDRSPYGAVARRMLDIGTSDAVALESVELQRPRLDRFMVSLSTIVTAAPLLGILGTVIGIIQSFDLLGQQDTLTDPRAISAGIAEALLTTALGLVVALITLFPYMIFRGHAARAMGHLESVIAAAQQCGRTGEGTGAAAPPGPEGTAHRLTPSEPRERAHDREPLVKNP